jgi:hypothetical protein
VDGEMKPIKTVRVKPAYLLEDSEVSIEELQKRLDGMKKFEFWGIEDDCRRFAKAMTLWQKEGLYKHFSETWELFVSDHIHKPMEWVNHIIRGVGILEGGVDSPIPAKDAISASRRVSQIAKGSPRREEKQQGKRNDLIQLRSYNYEVGSGSARDSSYLSQRIAESSPEVHAKMRAGEYSSVRSAAIDAGIVKPRTQATWKADATPEQIAKAISKKVSSELMAEVVKHLQSGKD